ncbi:MAG: LptF/LptG family permease [Verrucomicrobia bacterium]|nr:LptF/LptG family permease [Verrucomicrobiota bacterium]
MNLIDRYIFWEWMRVFLLALGATLGLLVIFDMYDHLGDLLDFRAPTGEILRYYVILLPTLLPHILPIAFLVSLLFSLSNLHGNNEIVALRSCGVSFWQITRSLWVAGLLLSGLLLYLNAKLVPWAVEAARQIWDDLEYNHELETQQVRNAGIIYNVAFDNPRDGRIWFMNRFNKYTYHGYGVTVSMLNEWNQEYAKIQATECLYNSSDRTWTFRKGRELGFQLETGNLETSKPFTTLELRNLVETPPLLLTLEKRAKHLSLFELQTILDYYKGQDNPKAVPYQVRFHSILAGTVICFIIVGLAVPYSVSGVRVNAMVGVSKSTGLFFAYFLVIKLAILLGEQGTVPPVYAAWIPNLMMAGFAMYLYGRLK